VCKGVKTLTGYKKRYVKVFTSNEIKQNAKSNGALMRCYPIALAGYIGMDYEKMIDQDCSITNPSKEYIQDIKKYIKSLIKVLKGKSKESILKDYQFPKDPPDIKDHRGYYCHALYCTYMGLRDFDNYQNAIKHIISMGGDTDTNACIAGALLGAYYGIEKMKKNKEFKNNFEIIKNCDTTQGDYPRPTEYSITKIKKMIKKIERIIEQDDVIKV
jgi:ADP-ribosylglycohydrolase